MNVRTPFRSILREPLAQSRQSGHVQLSLWECTALSCIVMLTLATRFARLGQQGFGNLFYAASVQSMLHSWHNAFFVAFDPRGFLAVDKPPVGLWIQAASVAVWGWSGWSLLMPQALAGTITPILVFALVRPRWGRNAALLAMLIAALTPIAVATDRNNTMDSMLVMVLLLALVCLRRAIATGHMLPLLGYAVLMGVGFNIKMLQAFLPLPAGIVWYMLAAPVSWRRRCGQVIIAAIVLVGISAVWVEAVDLTPASRRPFIASSTNSEWELVFGHNGGARVLENPTHAAAKPTAYVSDEIGTPGVWRLWEPQLAGQATWWLPTAFIGTILAIAMTRGDARAEAIFWALWLMPEVAFFSIGHKFHRHYLVMLAPPLAVLSGIGLSLLWRTMRATTWQRWLLPATLLITAASQASIVVGAPVWSIWLLPLVCIGTGIFVGLLIAALFRQRTPLMYTSLAGCLLVLGISPAIWAMTPIWGAHPSQPFAGPELLSLPDPHPPIPRLSAYMRQHSIGTPFLAATVRANTAATLMLATNSSVMSLGGYSGGDAILTAQQFAQYVADRQVQFVVLPHHVTQQEDIDRWTRGACQLVPAAEWREQKTNPELDTFALSASAFDLFDCQQMSESSQHS